VEIGSVALHLLAGKVFRKNSGRVNEYLIGIANLFFSFSNSQSTSSRKRMSPSSSSPPPTPPPPIVEPMVAESPRLLKDQRMDTCWQENQTHSVHRGLIRLEAHSISSLQVQEGQRFAKTDRACYKGVHLPCLHKNNRKFSLDRRGNFNI